jgi:hypothetical protein
LQSIGQTRACQQLKAFAEQGQGYSSDQIYVLCRLLFTHKDRIHFRSPDLFHPVFIGGTEERDWPLDPIALVDGVPFLIVPHYHGMGAYERPPHYLKYCMANCMWNSYRFNNKDANELEAALQKLLDSKKWKRTLTPQERQWLTGQIN